ncbi:MAG: hypothetical protein ACLQGV_06655 [Bryobacteraceae bacterium]
MRLLLAAVYLLLAAGVWAQEPPASNPPAAPAVSPEVTPEATEQEPAEYGGPAILSRGGSATVSREGRLMTLRPYATVSGIYDSGLENLSVNQEGQVSSTASFGEELRFGIDGSRDWQTTGIDLDYRGALRNYTTASNYDTFDNSLLLKVRHQVNRHVMVELQEEAARYTGSFTMPYNLGTYYDPLLNGLTGNELFNTPTFSLMSSARVVYQRTSRLSFSAGGTGFVVRRPAALFGAEGFIGSGDVAYRLTRYQTIGLAYSYTHFSYTHQVGSADLHGVSLNYSARMGKHWEFAMLGGGYRVQSRQVTEAQIDPAVAAIFGVAVGTQIFDRTLYAPHYEGHLTRDFHHSSWSLGYVHTMMPGNGVYSTSGYQNGQMSYVYNGIRKVSLQCSANYYGYSSVAQTLGRYSSYGAGGGASVKISQAFSLVARIDGRHYDADASTLLRTTYRATLGIAWSPGDRPLSIW